MGSMLVSKTKLKKRKTIGFFNRSQPKSVQPGLTNNDVQLLKKYLKFQENIVQQNDRTLTSFILFYCFMFLYLAFF